jgi:hypothetical protein
METINKGKRSTDQAAGQQAEMSLEEKKRKFSCAVEILETAIERAIRARFGIPG